MSKIYIPSAGAGSWQQFLAEPDKQWRTGFSAKTLAHCWEDADGFPQEVTTALNDPSVPNLNNLSPLIVLPEHKVPLPGGRTESQNDVFVLASSPIDLVTICIEGKVEEPFGDPISKWGPDSSPGKKERYRYLVDLLDLGGEDLSHIYYQLLHRTASAVIEAKRFHAPIAVMLVHSFSQQHAWFQEYSAFASIFGIQAGLNEIHFAGVRSGASLYIGWIVGDSKYLNR